MSSAHRLCLLLLLSLAAASACNRSKPVAGTPTDTASVAVQKAAVPYGWLAFPSDSVAGRFSHSGGNDTLRTCVMNRDRNVVFDSVQIDTVDWLNNQNIIGNEGLETAVYSPRTDTLWLRYFLNCLLNVGDVDGDGLDDLAVSDDVVDASSLNSCQIYSRKSGAWKSILSFQVNENSFYFGSPDARDSIQHMGRWVHLPDFLQRRKGGWYYQVYGDDDDVDDYGQRNWHRLLIKPVRKSR